MRLIKSVISVVNVGSNLRFVLGRVDGKRLSNKLKQLTNMYVVEDFFFTGLHSKSDAPFMIPSEGMKKDNLIKKDLRLLCNVIYLTIVHVESQS